MSDACRHWVRAEVVRDWRFWGLIPLATVTSIFGTALFFQQVHLAEVKGWSHVKLVALFPIFTVTSVVAGLIFGVILDHFIGWFGESVRVAAFQNLGISLA